MGKRDHIEIWTDGACEPNPGPGAYGVHIIGKNGRITEYDGIKIQPRSWWIKFWNRYERNTGYSRYEAIRRLRQQLGSNYMSRPVCDLYLRDILRK